MLRSTIRRRVGALFVTVGVLAAAGCGGSSGGSTETADTASSASSKPAETAASDTMSDTGDTMSETGDTMSDTAETMSETGDTMSSSAATGSATGAASTEDWDAILAAAKEEGEVTIYSSQALDNLNNLATQFEADTGIKLNVFRAIDSEIQAKVLAERDSNSPIADVVVQATGQWTLDGVDQGWFTPLDLPAWNEDGYNRELNVTNDGQSFVSNAAILTFGWNTELWPDGLTDYTGLLDPGLADGKVGVIEPSVASIVDFWLFLEENYGEDFVTQLAAQKPKIYPSSLPMGEALISGEISAASFVQVQDSFKADGAPVDSGLAPQVWGAIFETVVLENAPHPNAAKVLANYLITPAGQEAVAFRAASSLPDIPGTVAITSDKVRRQDLSVLTPEFVADYQERWKALFQG